MSFDADALAETDADAHADWGAPLVARLVSHHSARWVGQAQLTGFLAERGDRVLFFHGDPVRFPEVLDVAVVLPELQRSFAGRFEVGVVPRSDEDAVARRFGANRWPSLLFLRDGQYVTLLAGMHDWTDFVAKVAEALALPVGRAPTVGIPVVGAGQANGASHCH
jgi:hydrogenase-1 operon protein HyaE